MFSPLCLAACGSRNSEVKSAFFGMTHLGKIAMAPALIKLQLIQKLVKCSFKRHITCLDLTQLNLKDTKVDI
jgi:hypothetical protein